MATCSGFRPDPTQARRKVSRLCGALLLGGSVVLVMVFALGLVWVVTL